MRIASFILPIFKIIRIAVELWYPNLLLCKQNYLQIIIFALKNRKHENYMLSSKQCKIFIIYLIYSEGSISAEVQQEAMLTNTKRLSHR